MRKMQHYKFGLFTLIVLASVFNWYCSTNSSSNQDNPLDRTTYANLADTVKYVGMETCKGCHSGIHSTFIHTGMGL